MKSPDLLALLPILTPLLLCALAAAGCERPPAGDALEEGAALDEVARGYVELVLAVGQHDDDYVDAYYGPEVWREAAAAETVPLDELRRRGGTLRERLAAIDVDGADELVVLRRRYLDRQLAAVLARIDQLGGEKRSFDEESQALYDAVAPRHDAGHFEAVLEKLDARLAAEGYVGDGVMERYETFRNEFVVPEDRLDAVFRAAIDACRERTAAHLDLPEGESFVVEYVGDQPWSGYNWYQGGYHSLIQVNTDFPIYVDRAVDLACHEGYPGHHVYNMLLEKHLVNDRGWVEFSVYPLFSPQSLIAEGTANFGIEMAFPGAERLAFERETLFPLAGLDPERAALYYETQALLEELGYAGNEAARAYLDGDLDAVAAADWLVRYAAMSPDRAVQRVRFFDRYRSYVINYNLGQDLVRDYVERRAGDDPEARWRVFGELLASPRLPSDLR